jgi:predicted nucleic acid-binding protein
VTRVFLDANVLFTAAHNRSGKAALVIELGIRGHWGLATSGYAFEEARRNIEIKFPGSLSTLEAFRPAMKIVSSAEGMNCPVSLPEKDRPILEAAIRCKATHLLTGDRKHFGPFMSRPEVTSGVIILTVAEFLKYPPSRSVH